ncbi:MAG: protein-L-isoaspartate(D-aspartate) O-methyltransferase [Ignavibacteriae bacterium]|nr:protein-L-isoaspartate(D-aspartate) O-methyltransferase [Ignavibacteriota bacterium]MCB9244366.1 protein-L-isoaspartate(D-aspartate) O-methyltransferase [Ignavibacteriales bacterium]
MFSIQREKLVEELKAQGIRSKSVLGAIGKVKREMFLDKDMQRLAYKNNALPINSNQTISQPFTVAFMTELLDVNPGDKVLEIGTGSGYQAAVLCEMGADVYSIERIGELADKAKDTLKRMGYNLHVKQGDGTKGWELHSPYNRIIVTAGGPTVPKALLKQLAKNGKMVIPVGSESVQEMTLIERSGDDEPRFRAKKFQNFQFVPLIGEEGWVK